MPVENVMLNIMAKVSGTKDVRNLNLAMEGTAKYRRQLAQLRSMTRTQMGNEIDNMRKKLIIQNIIMEDDKAQLPILARQQARMEALDAVHRKYTETLKQENLVRMSKGQGIEREAEQEGALMIIEEQENRTKAEKIRLLQIQRRETLATTMSIFGMTMSIWQVTNAMSALAGENKEVREDIMRLQAVMMGATGPILLAMGMKQLGLAWANLNIAIKIGLPLFFTMASLYMSLTASSRELRVIFGALTGAMAGLTAMIAYHNIQKALEVKLTWAAVTAKLAEMGITTMGAGLVIGAAIIGGALAFMATVPQGAQTELGQFRHVARGGVAELHTDEVVSRPMEDWGGGTRGGGEFNFIFDGEIVDRIEAKRIERDNYVGWS